MYVLKHIDSVGGEAVLIPLEQREGKKKKTSPEAPLPKQLAPCCALMDETYHICWRELVLLLHCTAVEESWNRRISTPRAGDSTRVFLKARARVVQYCLSWSRSTARWTTKEGKRGSACRAQQFGLLGKLPCRCFVCR